MLVLLLVAARRTSAVSVSLLAYLIKLLSLLSFTYLLNYTVVVPCASFTLIATTFPFLHLVQAVALIRIQLVALRENFIRYRFIFLARWNNCIQDGAVLVATGPVVVRRKIDSFPGIRQRQR